MTRVKRPTPQPQRHDYGQPGGESFAARLSPPPFMLGAILLTLLLGACSPTNDPPTSALVTLTPSAIVPPTLTPRPPTEPPPTPVIPTLEIPTAAPPPPEPPPEPTPDPWPEALLEPTRSRMGIHVLLNDDPRILEFVRRAKPRVVKTVDNFDWLAEVKTISPATLTIGRHTNVPNRDVLDNKTPDQYPDPAVFARDFINTFVEDFSRHTHVDYWEGWNEFPPATPAQWDWFARFEAERACQMQALGFKAAIGGFSAGVPEYVDMARFLPAIEAAKRCGAIFTLHEYGSPTMQAGVGAGIPGAPASLHPIAGALTLRYRYWYEGYLKPRNLLVPLVISEAGVDSWVGSGCPDDPGQGWYGCVNDWRNAGLMDGDRAAWQVYMDQLSWYDQQLQQDDYVIGFTIFTAGTNLVSQWATFNINDLLVPMAAYIFTQR